MAAKNGGRINYKVSLKSLIICKINELLHFTQKFKMSAKKGAEMDFGKCCNITLQIIWRSKES